MTQNHASGIIIRVVSRLKQKIILSITFLWTCFLAFASPLIIGLIYMSVTGHGKGYDYDLGIERDVSIMFGVTDLIIFLALLLPSCIYVFSRFGKIGRAFTVIPTIAYIGLFIAGIYAIGGWNVFLSLFNITVN